MRVLIADRRPGVRLALRAILTRHSQLYIVGDVRYAEDLLPQVRQACPDLLLLSWEMADRKLLATLHRMCTALFVIVLSSRPEIRQLALDAGADAFVSKADPPECLLSAVRDSRCASIS